MKVTHSDIAVVALAAAFAAGVITACTPHSQEPPSTPPAVRQPATAALPTLADNKPADVGPLHNVVAYHQTADATLYSGAQPEGEAAFDQLAAMGIKTVISVDGAPPNLQALEARGLRSIHLPIGYNGFDDQRLLQLTRATRDAMAQGSVYLHCHHGKHRSAGAAAAALVSLGWAEPEAMVARMRVSGCSPAYAGLYAEAQSAHPLPASVIDAVNPDFPRVSRPSDFVEAMLEIDAAFDNLKLIQKSGWTTPKDHPDLVPAAEAARIAEHLRHLTDSPRAKASTLRPDAKDLLSLLREDTQEASELEAVLVELARLRALAPPASPARQSAARNPDRAFARVAASCKDCHALHRD